MVFSVSRAILRIVFRVLFGFRVEGREHEPPSGPLIVVSNHVSDLDPLVVGCAVRRPCHFMAKIELFGPPLLRWWVSACGAFPVRRGAPDRQALRTARAILERGGVLVMFPEGTRGTNSRDLRPPEPGAALLALRTRAAILPVAVIGTDTVLPRGAHRPSRGVIRVRIGTPMRAAGPDDPGGGVRADRDRIEEVGRQFMGMIGGLLAEAGQP
ncbi:MAG TPA: lysophospholipid acyltransferase family protein [bacterium]|nr:lysophospholipid acyltransferase family protein [bacterium]